MLTELIVHCPVQLEQALPVQHPERTGPTCPGDCKSKMTLLL